MYKTLVLFVCLFVFNLPNNGHANTDCSIAFARYINGELPSQLSKNATVNMWHETFDNRAVVKELSNYQTIEEAEKSLLEFTKLINNDKIYNHNLSEVVSALYKQKKISKKFIDTQFINKSYKAVSFKWNEKTRQVISAPLLDARKIKLIKSILSTGNLSTKAKKRYQFSLETSNLSLAQMRLLQKTNIALSNKETHVRRFEDYIDFINYTKTKDIEKAILQINNIYQFNYSLSILSATNPFKEPHVKFLFQLQKVKKFKLKRTKELERTFKLHQKSALVDEIDERMIKDANGLKVKLAEKIRFRKKIDESLLPKSLKVRAAAQARHEAQIFKKLLNGCRSGSGQHVKSAAKKFSRFKFSLGLGVYPAIHFLKNKDKMESDPYFFEKIGYEVAMGIVFTYVGNKLFTNTNKGFWRKYVDGYVQFGALSYIDSSGYEQLFGNKSFIRYFQKIYKADTGLSELEESYQELIKNPDFKKHVEELLSYLDEQSKINNTKNFIDKHFNLSSYSSLDNAEKITLEDLESVEGKEILMELLAERIYLENMGKWPFFQTGSQGHDRFLFYRARATLFDMKGLMLNLAIFDLMCRQPFGQVGSWGAILSLVVGDMLVTGNLTYGLRREAINQ